MQLLKDMSVQDVIHHLMSIQLVVPFDLSVLRSRKAPRELREKFTFQQIEALVFFPLLAGGYSHIVQARMLSLLTSDLNQGYMFERQIYFARLSEEHMHFVVCTVFEYLTQSPFWLGRMFNSLTFLEFQWQDPFHQPRRNS